MIWLSFLSLFNAFLAVGLGLLTWSRDFKNRTHTLFAGGMAAIAAMELGNGMAGITESLTSLLLWTRVSLSGEIWAPLFWFGFTLSLSHSSIKTQPSGWRLALLGFLLGSLCFQTLLFLAPFLHIVRSSEGGLPFLGLGPAGIGFFIYLILFAALILNRLERIYFSSSETQRWQLKFLLIGLATLFAFLIYVSSQYLLYSAVIPQLISIQSIPVFLSLTMVAFSLIRHRNLNVDIFVSRHVVYGSALTVLIGVYLLGAGLLGRFFGKLGAGLNPFLTPLWVFLVLVLLTVLLSSSQIRREIKLFISRNFYKHKYDFHLKWLEATRTLGAQRTIPELVRALSEFLCETIGAKRLDIWLYSSAQERFERLNKHSPGLEDSFLKTPKGFNQFLLENPYPSPIQKLAGEEDTRSTVQQLEEEAMAALVPLVAGRELVGFLAVGPDQSGKTYVQNDFDVMKAVGQQAAYQFLNARLAGELTSAREREVFHELSTFVIHDLKNFSNTLSLMARNARTHFDNPEYREEVFKGLDLIVEKLKTSTQRLSGLSKSYGIRPEAVDIPGLISESIKSINQTVKVEVQTDSSTPSPVMLDREQIQTVLVNLLTNAAQAMNGKGQIEVRSEFKRPWLILSVRDHGSGMSRDFIEKKLFKPFQTTKSNGMGIGLYQSQKFIEAHGGRITVESQEGKGSTFSLHLPVKEPVK